MLSNASNFIKEVDGVFLFILGVSVLLLILITFLMVYFVIKYNRKKNLTPKNIKGNTTLEIIWTVIPTILVVGMFYYGWYGYKKMTAAPKDAFEINVTGKMWAWEFTYPNGMKTDTLVVPINKPIKLNLQSIDVNHSFFIPAFRIKRDVIPNKNNYLWFIAEEVGVYDIACAEYCGLRHSYMYSKLYAIHQNEFDEWYKAKLDTTVVK
ncbi:MAG: cytochrome c oxidase subunit II [Ignavibacteria bacterium]|jgi:cytochrome c oxidase subunit 2|nr:cytochrome c oxidase subunit II [Ignavibacteria bacterium]MDH7528732.1 cytochrome c oxidase subunit II [Ignavibacteria bacterium]NPV10230.1 cytochrome c oxidase subunit II [Ignavibacteria bacterium]